MVGSFKRNLSKIISLSLFNLSTIYKPVSVLTGDVSFHLFHVVEFLSIIEVFKSWKNLLNCQNCFSMLESQRAIPKIRFIIILKNLMKLTHSYRRCCFNSVPRKPQNETRKTGESREKQQVHVDARYLSSKTNHEKMLLLFALMSSFQALIATASEDPSSRDETLIGSAKKIAVRVVGGEITNIRNYPFLVGEMRP